MQRKDIQSNRIALGRRGVLAGGAAALAGMRHRVHARQPSCRRAS